MPLDPDSALSFFLLRVIRIPNMRSGTARGIRYQHFYAGIWVTPGLNENVMVPTNPKHFIWKIYFYFSSNGLRSSVFLTAL
jgi:hypothetical protein